LRGRISEAGSRLDDAGAEDPLESPLIYIADDSDVVRRTVRRRLEAAGLRVHAGGSAADSRNVTIRGFACALLDLDLGDGDGVDVAELLRVHQPDLPVAFFSGGASPAIVARATALGPIFHKPDDLDAAVAWVVARARR
jgi:two-component system response regulator RegA